MAGLIFDTTFLIDFQRERKAGHGKTLRFMEMHTGSLAFLPVIAMGEYAEGFESLADPNFIHVVDSFALLLVTEKVARIYAQLIKALRSQGNLIGSNDIWIAATALDKGLPLVTQNLDHFARIPDLEVRGY